MPILSALSDSFIGGIPQMKLLNGDGSPVGFNFRRHGKNAFILRVKGESQQADFGITPDNIAYVYEKAIDKRLEFLGIPDDAEAWQTLASAYGAFLARYSVEIKPVTHYEFNIKGEVK
jgi:hypothetical protein